MYRLAHYLQSFTRVKPMWNEKDATFFTKCYWRELGGSRALEGVDLFSPASIKSINGKNEHQNYSVLAQHLHEPE